ncbi:hypothetical protein [Streptomyces kanamyceticus]
MPQTSAAPVELGSGLGQRRHVDGFHHSELGMYTLVEAVLKQ